MARVLFHYPERQGLPLRLWSHLACFCILLTFLTKADLIAEDLIKSSIKITLSDNDKNIPYSIRLEKIMQSRLVILVTSLLLLTCLVPVAHADEITFQAFEVDLGQSSPGDIAIDGDEWLSYGIDMSGTGLFVYGANDPFSPDDRNGIFEGTGSSFELEFTSPVVNLDVSWWSPASQGVTVTAYDVNGTEIEAQASSVEFDVFSFSGKVKRIVIEAPQASLCLANLRFDMATSSIPTLGQLGLLIMILAMLVFGGLVLRRRVFSA